eukprot:scaffold17777_cov136-Isochrysis_galbana.AAC.1
MAPCLRWCLQAAIHFYPLQLSLLGKIKRPERWTRHLLKDRRANTSALRTLRRAKARTTPHDTPLAC